MRVLITRRDSPVGRELAHRLEPRAEILAPRTAELDLDDPDSIVRAIRAGRPDLVVHTAACAEPVETDPDAALSLYAHAPRILAEEADHIGCAIVHFSTDRVFDGRTERPYAEDDPTVPIGVAGKAMRLGERAVAGCGVPHLVLRLAWVYGRRDIRERVGWSAMSESGADPSWRGSPTWNGDVAEATIRILDGVAEGEPLSRDRLYLRLHERGGLYHVSAGGSTTPSAFAAAIDARIRESGVHPPTESGTAPKGPIGKPHRNRLLDTSKLERELDVRLPEWSAGLDACVADVTAAHAAGPVASR